MQKAAKGKKNLKEIDKKRGTAETNREERGSGSRESEGEADKEYIMKLCSAGSVKGSNLLIKDRD